MYDNKVRLSQDVIEKAEHIAAEWGLKNARAAVEAVFRCYCDEYLHGRDRDPVSSRAGAGAMRSSFPNGAIAHPAQMAAQQSFEQLTPPESEAMDALEDLLAM